MSEFEISPAAEAIWLQHLSRRLGGEPVDLEQLRAAHPRFAHEFERLEADWQRSSQGGARDVTASRVRDQRLESVLERLARLRPGAAKYELRGEIGRGGMGVVQRVWDDSLKRELAMKTVHASFGLAREQALARFVEEAQILAQLDHPSIVPIHDLGVDEQGRPFFVMKLVVGRDLGAIVALAREEREGWSTTRALDVLLRVCEAVGYAHRKGVVHRDLKPSNVMVGDLGEVYVMDWGIARVLREGAGATLETVRTLPLDSGAPDQLNTGDGVIVGTVAYMAPEQARGELSGVTSRSDVYALGAMLYELLAGRAPYARAGASSRQLLLSLLAGPPMPLARVAPKAPPELIAIADKALSREASKRYADLAEVALELRAYLEGRVVRAHRTGVLIEASKWVKRNKALSGTAAAAVGISILGATTYVVQANETAARSREVFALAAQSDLDALVAQAEQLWPPHAELIDDYERWLAAARRLTSVEPQSSGRGEEWRRTLGGLRQQLDELRAGALPLTAEQLAADRASHPALAELSGKRRELTWCRRMLGDEPWPSEEVARASLRDLLERASSVELIVRSNDLIGTDWRRHGSEIEAVVLAQRAVESADDEHRPLAQAQLSKALHKAGRLDEAIELARAVDRSAPRPPNAVSVSDLERAAADWRDFGARRRDVDRLNVQIERLEQQVARRRTFLYDAGATELAWWDSQLAQLVESLERFARPGEGLMENSVDPLLGWGVARRLEAARRLHERTILSNEARRRWAEAIAAVESSPSYGGLRLSPQFGLLPVGPDPNSGLWEFAHLLSGEPPVRDEHSRLFLTEESAIVLVLLPGGIATVGAQAAGSDRPNYDPTLTQDARDGVQEGPVHCVELAPFFISKFEMTQAQWLRFTAQRPSYNSSREGAGLLPVEMVSWNDASTTLLRMGLELPTEVQWEYACRAGTSTPHWTGADRTMLAGAANLHDQSSEQRSQMLLDAPGEAWDDGWPDLAPVGQFRANAMGVHDTHGNLWEWCREANCDYFETARPGDGQRVGWDRRWRILRGGAFDGVADEARSSTRLMRPAEAKAWDIGVRPSRALVE